VPTGTKDNHRLLPLQVTQAVPADAQLIATDGKMLSLLLQNPEYFTIKVIAPIKQPKMKCR